MIIFATVLSWLLVQFQIPLQSLHRDEWLWPWANAVARVVTPVAGARVATGFALLLPVAALAAVLALFGNWLFGGVGLAVAVAALIYSCGRGDYQAACDAQVDALIDTAFDTGKDPVSAVTRTSAATPTVDAVRAQLNFQAYERWFPVLVWFLVLGAPGAVFYRLLVVYARGEAPVELSSNFDIDSDPDALLAAAEVEVEGAGDMQGDAQSLLGWLDWLPARMWALGCALAGNFSAAFAVLSGRFTNVEATIDLLDAVVLAAADLPQIEAVQADAVQADAVQADAAQTESRQVEETRASALVIERCCELNQRVMVVALVIVLFIVFFL